MKQQKLIPKPKKFHYVHSKEDLCPLKDEPLKWFRCEYCAYYVFAWKRIDYDKKEMEFTVKCKCPNKVNKLIGYKNIIKMDIN